MNNQRNHQEQNNQKGDSQCERAANLFSTFFHNRTLPREIRSLQHPLIKTLVKIRIDKATRDRLQESIVMGENLIFDLAKRHPLNLVLHTKNILPPPGRQTVEVTAPIMEKITGLKKPEGLAAALTQPTPVLFTTQSPLLVCDHIQDPGNLGTLIRTAYALGFKGVVLLNHCVDPFNDKALRSAKGATFDLPISYTLPENYHLYATNLKGAPITTIQYKHPAALILGNESQGISLPLQKKAISITIAMEENINSLNVAIAGAIAMHTIREAL